MNILVTGGCGFIGVRLYADIRKISKKLGFKPKVSFKEGMEELINWSEAQEAIDLLKKLLRN